jgi:hypothetical protein
MQAKISDTSLLRHLPNIRNVTLEELGNRNAEISDVISQTNAQRVLGILRSNPNFMRFRGALLATLLSAGDFENFLTAEELRQYRANLPRITDEINQARSAYFQQREAAQIATGFLPNRYQAFQNRLIDSSVGNKRELEVLQRLRFLSDQMGVSIDDWFTARNPGTYVAASNRSGMFFQLVPLLLDELREIDSEIVGNFQYQRSERFLIHPNGATLRNIAREVHGKAQRESAVSARAPSLSARFHQISDNCRVWFSGLRLGQIPPR